MMVVRMIAWYVTVHVVLVGHILYSLALLAWYGAKEIYLKTCILAVRLYVYVRHGPEGLASFDCPDEKGGIMP